MLAKSRQLELGCERVGELKENHRPGSLHCVMECMIPTSGLALARSCCRLCALEDEGCAGCQPVPAAAGTLCMLFACSWLVPHSSAWSPSCCPTQRSVVLSDVCSSWKGAGSSLSLTKGDPKTRLGLLDCLSLLFFFFPSRSCCQCCFSGKFPAGLHNGLGRVLPTAGCLLRADTRAGSGPQPGLYSPSPNPSAPSLGQFGILALP